MKTKSEYYTGDNLIPLDSVFAQEIGFTSDKFEKDSYFWKIENKIVISVIFSKQPGKGNFSALLNKIFKLGFDIEVTNPVIKMESILLKKGFTYIGQTREGNQIWRLSNKCK